MNNTVIFQTKLNKAYVIYYIYQSTIYIILNKTINKQNTIIAVTLHVLIITH